MSLINRIAGHNPDFQANSNVLEGFYFPNWEELMVKVDAFRAIGAKIVLTQGVFDMYHSGHGKYLLAAKGFGDVLIVGVDSDQLTKQRKGPKRPLDPEQDRLEALACVRGVDILTLRPACPDEELDSLVKLIRPDVLITSHTTQDVDDKIREALSPYCGEVVALPPQASTSTTARLRRVADETLGEVREKFMETLGNMTSGGGSQ